MYLQKWSNTPRLLQRTSGLRRRRGSPGPPRRKDRDNRRLHTRIVARQVLELRHDECLAPQRPDGDDLGKRGEALLRPGAIPIACETENDRPRLCRECAEER